MDKVSIIVPVYNIQVYLPRCLDSLLTQTWGNTEIILVDDGSTDSSGIICDEYADANPNIIVIHKKNQGLGMARNSGLSLATGDYICFIDGDDYIDEDHIENLMNRLLEDRSDACLCGYTRDTHAGMVVHRNSLAGKVLNKEDILTVLLPRFTGKKHDLTDYVEMSACMTIFSHKIIKENNILFLSEREFISEDLLFDFDYYPCCSRVSISDDCGYHYCDNEGSLTNSYRRDRFEKQRSLFLTMTDKTKDLGIYDLCEQRLATTFISIARYSIKLEEKFSDVNGKAKARINVINICSDPFLKHALASYKNNLVPLKSRVVNWLIKYQKINLLMLVMHFKNKHDC